MPPPFTQNMKVNHTTFYEVFAGQPGIANAQTLYTVPATVNFSLIFVSQLTQEGPNDPAFILNIGTSANYEGGVRNNQPGEPPFIPLQGNYQDHFGPGLTMQTGERIDMQLANPGSFIVGFDIYEFTAV